MLITIVSVLCFYADKQLPSQRKAKVSAAVPKKGGFTPEPYPQFIASHQTRLLLLPPLAPLFITSIVNWLVLILKTQKDILGF